MQRVKDGKTPLTKDAIAWDPELRPYQEIILVDEKNNVVGTGKVLVTAREMKEITAPALKMRHRIK
ncbi:MAG: hypothetical protein GXN93_00930 [Candidatus Diapherotrites archaeon]|nr:hypothetical protein [Candidatus Diapherotrites archaeon]